MAKGTVELLGALNELLGTHVDGHTSLDDGSTMFAQMIRDRFLKAAPSPTDTVSISPVVTISGADNHYFLSSSGVTSSGAPVTHSDTILKQAVAAAGETERQRILSAIQELRPPNRPKTNGDWARSWREAGELAMWEKIVKAIEEAK